MARVLTTVEPVFQTPQAVAATRFLYLREVDELLRQGTEADKEALARKQAAWASSDSESEGPSEDSAPSPVAIQERSTPSTRQFASLWARLILWGAVHAVIDDQVPVLHTDMRVCKRKACLVMFD